MKTAMQDLRNDLVETISSSKKALKKINNEETRLACQYVVKRTLNAIIKRIDDELFEIEKKQIIDAYNSGQQIPPFEHANEYYKQTFII